MPSITVTQPCSLPLPDAHARLDTMLASLSGQYGGSYQWTSDVQATISASVAKGTLTIQPDQVVVQVDGGFAFGFIKGKVQDKVQEELQKALAPAPPPAVV